MNSSTYIAILGRQPKLGIAELERRFGAAAVTPLNDSAALLTTAERVSIDQLGGSVKLARLVERTASNGWLGVSKQAVGYLLRDLDRASGKTTLGFSAYGFNVGPRDVQKTGLIVKARIKNAGGSLRLVPNTESALSSAQVFHNKLTGGSKRELILVAGSDGHGYIAETIGVQNIDAYTLRDRGRPKRDPLNGMLPPKLAQTMINLGAGTNARGRILDPFCGTGVVLMEAALMGHAVYGTDMNEKMIVYTRDNLNWLKDTYPVSFDWYIHQADAREAAWQQPVDAVVSETFLGEPMAQEPPAEKLARVMDTCEQIVRGFLVNFAAQAKAGTELCIAVPAWRIAGSGTQRKIRHLPVVDDLEDLGYNWIDFEHVDRSDLLYYREDQVVARELLVIKKA